MSRETLHQLVDRIPDSDMSAAQRFLEFLASSPALRAALLAPADDEAVTEEDMAAVRRSDTEIHEGRVASHEDLLREFDLK